MTDPSVRETAARAVDESPALGCGCCADTGFDVEPGWRQVALADAVLAAVADHDGLADVLRGHQERETTMKGRRPILLCECGHELHFSAEAEAAHLADVVRAWLLT